jgi:hypothetical protein
VKPMTEPTQLVTPEQARIARHCAGTIRGAVPQPDPTPSAPETGAFERVNGQWQCQACGNFVDHRPRKCACGGGREADEPAPPATTKPAPGGLAAIVGRWPGDETEAELLAALKGKPDVSKESQKPNTSGERVSSDNTSAGPLTLAERALYAVQNCRILETTEDEDAQAIARLATDFARDALREFCAKRGQIDDDTETDINAAIEAAAAKGVRR